MTEKEINHVIAEFYGYKFIAFNKAWIISGDRETQVNIPDYCNDLNAMHKAETLLDDDLWLKYMLNLQDVLQRDPDRGKWIVCQDNMHSTAAQRAKAFVKTIGKCKE